MVIPIYDESGAIVNLQFIATDGTKRFLSGGRKKGCYYLLGGDGSKVLVCEGFATGASLSESTLCAVFIAFDAGNLKPVAMLAKKISPVSDIIICGDNDESGVGQHKAHVAALACGGKVFIPPVPGFDWNDYAVQGGVA